MVRTKFELTGYKFQRFSKQKQENKTNKIKVL